MVGDGRQEFKKKSACPPSSGMLAPCPSRSRPDFPQDGARRRLRLVLHRPSRAESDLIAETTCLIGKLKAQIERCRSAFFAAAPADGGRQDPDPRPCAAAGNGPPSSPVGFESTAGRILPGGILEAPDVLQSESSGQISLGQRKTCRAKTSNCPRRSISRMEIHSASCRTGNDKVRFPPQSVSAERIRRAFSLIDACGNLFGRFGSAVTELRAADLGKAFPSWSSARQARRLQSGGSRRRIGARRHRIGACRVRRGRCRVRRGRY